MLMIPSCTSHSMETACLWIPPSLKQLHLAPVHDKTRDGPISRCHCVADVRISVSGSVKNLGVMISSTPSFNKPRREHVKTSESSHAQAFDRATAASRLDYTVTRFSTALLFPTSVKVQRIQNTTARVVTGAQRAQHMRPVLAQVYWLPISARMTSTNLCS